MAKTNNAHRNFVLQLEKKIVKVEIRGSTRYKFIQYHMIPMIPDRTSNWFKRWKHWWKFPPPPRESHKLHKHFPPPRLKWKFVTCVKIADTGFDTHVSIVKMFIHLVKLFQRFVFQFHYVLDVRYCFNLKSSGIYLSKFINYPVVISKCYFHCK